MTAAQADRALRAAVTVGHHTAWDSARDIARMLVHAAEVAYSPDVPHVAECVTCEEAKAYAAMLRAALDSWDRSHV
jgi:hypothetical protein